MTHQSYQTNGASLEDCHTNFFALADLCGIKWKKLVLNERPHATGDPLEDPVLKSYTKCLAKDLLCVWRRVSQPKNDLHDQTGGLNMFDISQNLYTSVIHPPLSLTAAKELWIFWYGEEPDLTDLVSPELLKSTESDSGSWETGLSYECRSLLFKALHNLIERCLLSRDIVRLGRWFVQPSIDSYGRSSAHLSFSFAFFVHGDSTVCASMDIREHPPVRPLTEEYLNEVIKNSQQNVDNDVEEKDEFSDINQNISMQSVILAPFGLSAVLTGNKSENFEQYADKIISDWNAFYPMKIGGENESFSSKSSSLPPLVEVILGGIKMLYPSKYVLITDIDLEKNRKDKCTSSENNNNNIPSNNLSSKRCVNSEKKMIAFDKDSIESNLLNICDGIQKSATSMPERVWQDMIMNPAYTGDKSEKNMMKNHSDANNVENSINVANTENSAWSCQGGLWNFTEPCLKNPCSCKRSGSLKAPGNSSSLSGKSNFRNNSNRTRTPFHKRSESSLSRSKECRFSNEPTSSKKFNIRSSSEKNSTSNSGGNISSNQGNETQQMSIGSVGTASPMQQSLSVHSQPSSIPINDQSIISPHQNDVSPHPLTPILENTNINNIKTENEDHKTVGGGSSSADMNKHEQQQKQAQETNDATKMLNGPTSSLAASSSAITTATKHESLSRENVLKRPALKIQDCENNNEEDFTTNQSLYDYSTWDAWMNHPIKRFKADDYERTKTSKINKYDLYSGQKHAEMQQQNMPNYLAQTIKSELGGLWTNGDEAKATNASAGGSKEGKTESESEKLSSDNLFTSEGLQPSYADLNKIFDNSDDNSNDDHIVDNTPPGSNNSINCHPDMELSEHETKRDKMAFSSPFSTLSTLINNVSSNNSVSNTLGIIRNEELSKMFPTPPSIEQHTNSSPGGICGTISDNINENIESSVSSAHKMEVYPNFGSPPEDPIDDWSYVFIPPKMSSIVNSSKYSPLNNLLCQTLTTPTLPPECTYEPTWVKQKEKNEKLKKQQQQQSDDAKMDVVAIKKEPLDLLDIKKEIKMEPMSPMPTKQIIAQLKTQNMKSSTDANANPILNKFLSQGPSNSYLNRNLHPPPMESPSSNFQPIPYTSPYGASGSIIKMGMNMPTPSHPPPPYEMHKMNQTRVGQPLSSSTSSGSPKVSEASSLLVNVLLYDTSLNIFRDHNFDSCSICVCNASPKCVGNIRGLDAGIYLSLATNCHFNTNLSAIVDKSFEGHSVDPRGVTKYLGHSKNFIHSDTQNAALPVLPSLSCPSCQPSQIPTSELVPSLLNNPPQLNLSGYVDDDPIFCHCGFSAVINRRLAHQTGLFYEDEIEITGMARDPSSHKKRSLMALLSGDGKKENEALDNIIIKKEPGLDDKESNVTSSSSITKNATSISMSIFDLIRDQCSIFQNSSNTIQRAIKHLNQERYSPLVANKHVNILEFIDALDIVSLALEQSRFIFERFDGYNNRQVYQQQQQQPNRSQLEKKSSTHQHIISVHKWPYLNSAGPKSNHDIIRVMRSMKVLLQKAFNQNGTTGLWDAPYAVRGPLTWREFHRLAGRGIGQCEPQPIPSVVVGHDKEWLGISPYALHFWDKLLLEPYSYPRDIAYLVITPDNEFITSRVKAFFKELSTTYEMCRLGKHQPVKGWEGILKVGKPVLQNKREDPSAFESDDWLQTIDSNKLTELLKLYSATFQQHLVPYLSKIPQDQTLLNPPESFYNYKDHHHRTSTSLPSPMLPPHTPESLHNINAGPNTPKSDHDNESKDLNNSSSGIDLMSHQLQTDQPLNPPHIVLYIVEPFTNGTDSTSLERVACLSLLKQYSNILNSIPESIRMNITLQIIAQESILELGKNRDINRWSEHMRNLSLSVFTSAYRYLQHTNNVKSLTGFGTAASAEEFMKTKDEKNRKPYKLYTPPYILSTRTAKSENVETFGQSGMEQQCTSIMYCCYCLSEDQSMLLAVITDERGEFIENCAINIDIPNRKRRRRSSARRIGLKKLMDFILGVMSQTVKPWRLVIGRIGRIGHGELKGWSYLLSKSNLAKASKYLKEICKQCQVMSGTQAVPSIWSACLVTLEPDSSFRVMPDQFTPDERFSQRSTQSQLSTPQDVTCTHILVFPTSAISQSNQNVFHEQHLENPLDFGEDLGILDIGDDADDVEDDINGFQHLFDNWNDSTVGMAQPGSPTRDSHRGSPTDMDADKSRQSPGISDPQSGSSRAMFTMAEQEEVGQLLQQPLALGYLVSTAPTGRMPTWFWASCPHLENVCPVFLKTALHIHSPSVHKENDDIYFKEQSSRIEHPLDSNTTADVLRYVLEGYNVLSWLAMDSNTHDRLSCLPVHVQMLMQLYHLHTALA